MNVRRMALAAASALVGLLALAGPASAGSDVMRERLVIDLAGGVEDGCDEPILLTAGQVVETIQVFDDGNGRTHFLYHAHTFGVEGIGLDSGGLYTDRTHITQGGVASIEEGFATGGFTEHIRITSKDGANASLVLRWRFHLVKREGVNRVVLDSFTASCV